MTLVIPDNLSEYILIRGSYSFSDLRNIMKLSFDFREDFRTYQQDMIQNKQHNSISLSILHVTIFKRSHEFSE